MFAFNKFTRNSSIMIEKGRIHSGMLLSVFAVNYSQKRRTRPPYHRGEAGRQEQILNVGHGAVAHRLTDRGRPSATPSNKKKQQDSCSSRSSAVAGGGGAGGDGSGR